MAGSECNIYSCVSAGGKQQQQQVSWTDGLYTNNKSRAVNLGAHNVVEVCWGGGQQLVGRLMSAVYFAVVGFCCCCYCSRIRPTLEVESERAEEPEDEKLSPRLMAAQSTNRVAVQWRKLTRGRPSIVGSWRANLQQLQTTGCRSSAGSVISHSIGAEWKKECAPWTHEHEHEH